MQQCAQQRLCPSWPYACDVQAPPLWRQPPLHRPPPPACSCLAAAWQPTQHSHLTTHPTHASRLYNTLDTHSYTLIHHTNHHGYVTCAARVCCMRIGVVEVGSPRSGAAPQPPLTPRPAPPWAATAHKAWYMTQYMVCHAKCAGGEPVCGVVSGRLQRQTTWPLLTPRALTLTIARPPCAADSAQSSAHTTAQQAKEGASAAASEIKQGVTGDKALGHAVSDAGTEASRAADDVSTEAQRGAEDAKREERMQSGGVLDSASAYVEQAGADISRAVQDATTSAERAGDDADTKAERASNV